MRPLFVTTQVWPSLLSYCCHQLSEIAEFETVLLVGAGIGVTPFASILKSIWYRMNASPDSRERSTTRLSKVYFVHICRDSMSQVSGM